MIVEYKKTVFLIDEDVIVQILRFVKDEQYNSSTKVLETSFSAYDGCFGFFKSIFKSENGLINKEFDMAHKWADKQIEILKEKESLEFFNSHHVKNILET